jgi:glycosyltransferase involved in cell wall biosynthesis
MLALPAFPRGTRSSSGPLTPHRLWTINGRFLAQRTTGVQRYAREIVLAMDALITEGHPLTERLRVEVLVPPDANSVSLRSISVRSAGPLSGQLWEQLVLASQARGGLLSLGNTSAILARKQVVCIHDANVILVPESYSRGFRGLYKCLLPLIGRSARTVVTVSHFSKAQISAASIAPAYKIAVAHNGHEHVHAWGSGGSDDACFPEAARMVVALGSLAPHKNLRTLLAIAPELARNGLKLAVVGGFDRRVFGASERGPADDGVLWLGTLSDDQLGCLLRRAHCLAFPSLAEGFGLPPLEAMALGCPVVVSDRTSLPEVCGHAALYAPALLPEAWLEQILSLRNEGLRRQLISAGKSRAERFSWRRSAKVFLSAMASADGLTIRN